MTMQISRKQIIGGLLATQVQKLLLETRAGGFSGKQLESKRLSPEQVSTLTCALLKDGYVNRLPVDASSGTDQSPRYELTKLGQSLALSTTGKRIARDVADQALPEIVARVEALNANSTFPAKVTLLLVFGSYMREVPTLGDLDISFSYESKEKDSWASYNKYWDDAGSPGRQIYGPYILVEKTIVKAITGGKKFISAEQIHSLATLPELQDFRYKVLIGDATSVEVALAEGRK